LDTSSFVIQPGKIINYTPHTTFFNSAKITVISDFEGNVNFAKCGGNIPMVKSIDNSLGFYGSGCGSITLSAVGDSSVDSSTLIQPQIVIPAGTSSIEFDYKSDLSFYVGLQANLSNLYSTGATYLTGVYPSDHWKKFYLDVSVFATKYQGTSYTLFIKTSLSAGQTSGRLLIDNIQLLTF
jgi:hypothetical protein